MAAIAAGVEDVRYDANPIVNDRANTGNLLTLLAYCSDVMLNYKGMDEFETENIRTFAKQDLFSRFALDNFAAIHQLFKDGKRVSPSVRKIYSELTSVLGTEMLDKRIKSLRRASFGTEF